MSGTTITFPTDGGRADGWFSTPTSAGPWPAVIMFMDAFGLRPTLYDMADELASHGYCVLVPDMLWRSAPFAPFNPKQALSDPPERDRLMKILGAVTLDTATSDIGSALDYLATRAEVLGASRVACEGYCFGGGLAALAACKFPDRIVAAAAFHGSRFLLSPEAPEMIAAHARASFYIGVAETDQHHTAEKSQQLEAAFKRADVPFEIETYAGAGHGFAVPDSAAFDAAASAKHWERLLQLLQDTFRPV